MGRASHRKEQRAKEQNGADRRALGGGAVPPRGTWGARGAVPQEKIAVLQPGQGGFFARRSVVLLILSLLALLIYGNTFSFPFQFDDQNNIVINTQIRNLAHLDFSGTRSLGFLSFALNYHFGALNVFGYHLVNLLIHITNGFLVYWLVLLLFRASAFGQAQGPAPTLHASRFTLHTQPIALFTALLFIVHPIQTQAVTYIVQRFASLMTLFYLLAVVCYLKWRLSSSAERLQTTDDRLQFKKNCSLWSVVCGLWSPWYFASLLSTLLAMKTKENSFTLPLMILLVEMVFFKPVRSDQRLGSAALPPQVPGALRPVWRPKYPKEGLLRRRELCERLKAVIPFFLLAVPIIPFSHQNALGEAEGFARDATDVSRLEYLFTQFRVIVTYLRLLILPINQTLDYDYPVYHSLFVPPVFISFLFLLSLAGSAVYLLFRPRFTHDASRFTMLIAFGCLWFFLTLAVESSIVPIKDVIVEHRVYLPSVGFFLALSLLAFGAWERSRSETSTLGAAGPLIRRKQMRTPFLILAILVLAVLSIVAHRRNLVWQDNITLWQDVVEKAPQKPRANYNLGFAYQEADMFEKAIGLYQKTVRLKPDYAEAYNNMGASYAHVGRFDEAVKALQQAFAVKPDNAEARYNLGSVYTSRGRLEEAIPLYQKAIELKPDYFEAHNNLGTVYALQGRIEEAVSEYRKALEINPDYAEAARNLDYVTTHPDGAVDTPPWMSK